MVCNDVFDKGKLNIDNLIFYGFKKGNVSYEYKKNLNEDLYVLFKVNEKSFIYDVYDNFDNLYLPFNVKENYGSYVLSIKDKVEKIKEDIINKCFSKDDFKSMILSYVHKIYNTKEEYPWKDMKEYFTLKVNNKWYLLYMNIPYKSINKDKEGKVDVINVKLMPNEIENLIDYKTYYPAYHMNKKYWMTIVLDNNAQFEIVKSLIDRSYEIVSKK